MNKTHIIIKVVDDINNNSLTDAYVTDDEHLGKDVHSLINSIPLTYGIPKYIKIIALQDKESIPKDETKLSQEDVDVIKKGIEKLKEECDGKGVVWADDFVRRTLDDLESKKKTLNNILITLKEITKYNENPPLSILNLIDDIEKGNI